MRIAIEHKTTYRYPGEVLHTAQYLHLTPRNNSSQWVIDWRIQAPGQLTGWEDAYGNACHTLVEDRPTTEIVIIAKAASIPPIRAAFCRLMMMSRRSTFSCDQRL